MDLMPSLFETFLELWDETLQSFESVWSRLPNGQFDGADGTPALSLFKSRGYELPYNGLEFDYMPMSPAQVLIPPLRYFCIIVFVEIEFYF